VIEFLLGLPFTAAWEWIFMRPFRWIGEWAHPPKP
jgi:hypothetical protein